MELIHTYQTTLEEINAEKFDVLIAGCGYQNRCNDLLRNLSVLPDKRIVFARNESGKLFFRNQQTDLFEQHDFEVLKLKDDQIDVIHQYLRQLIQNNSNHKISILVDYSCMPFQWYNQIIETLLHADQYLNKAEIYFAYIPASSEINPGKQKIKKQVYSVNYQKNKSEKPLALVIDLGLSEQITKEILALYKPQKVVYFIASGAFHKEKSTAILDHHMELLKQTDENNVLDYPVENLEETMHRISSQCLNLRLNYHVTIASFGAKPFKLAALLMQQQYADVSVCDIQVQTEHKDTGEPIYQPIIAKTIFLSDEVIEEMEEDEDVEEEWTMEERLSGTDRDQ